MTSPGAIRAGGVYVEVGADDSSLPRSLAATQERLRAWVAQNQAQFTKATKGALSGEGGGKGFMSGGFRGADLMGTGLQLMTFVKGLEAVTITGQIFAAALENDTASVRRLGESLPLVGNLVKLLGPLADSAAKGLLQHAGWDVVGAYDSGATAKAEKDRAAQAKAWNEGLKIIEGQETAFRKMTMSARGFFEWQLKAKGLGQEQLGQALAWFDATQATKTAENALAAERSEAAEQSKRDLSAREEAARAYARTTLTPRQLIEAEVQGMHLSAAAEKEVLAAKLLTLEITEKQAAAEKEARQELQAAAEAARQAETERQHDEQLRFRNEMDLVEKANRVHEETMSAKERFLNKQGELKELLGVGLIDKPEYDQAIRDALEQAARSLPDAVARTVGVRGTFNPMEAAGIGAGTAQDRIAAATEKTAKMTEKIAQLAKDWGLNFN